MYKYTDVEGSFGGDRNVAQSCDYIENTEYTLSMGPAWCGSVGWVSSWEPKGRWFNSWSGHMPGLWARSLAGGVREATN